MSIVRSLVRTFVPLAPTPFEPPVITAVLTPEKPPFFHGGTLEDVVPDWDEIVLATNYVSSAGNIQTPVVTFLGDAIDETTPFVAGQTVGYSITVGDDAGSTPRVFAVGPDAVLALAPSLVTTLIATAGAGEISLSWAAPAVDGGSAITDYQIDRNADGAGWTVVTDSVGTGTSFTDTGLTNGVVYQYRVSAINGAGTGPVSNVATATLSGDVIAPVISATSFDDGTKTITFVVSEACNLLVATHLAADTLTPDGVGGWTGATIETFTQAVTGTGTVTLTVADQTAERITYYARDAGGNDSLELITETITFAPLGAFTDDFERADQPLSDSADWAVFAANGLDIVSGNADSTSSNQNASRYTGAVADDLYIEATVAGTDTQWIYLRATDFNNCLAFQLRNNGSVRIYNRVAGDNGTIVWSGNFSTAKAIGDVFRIALSGTEATVSKNGIDATTTDIGTTYTTGDTAVGVAGEFAGFAAIEIGDL